MSKRSAPPGFPGLTDVPMPDRLVEASLPEPVKEALMLFDRAFFRWYRLVSKGELTAQLLRDLGLDVEVSDFAGLTAIMRITYGVGRCGAGEAPTIGLLAEEMTIDPSRASRIAAQLIAKGLVQREAAQEDGRKSVLRLTDKGREIFDLVRDRRWKRMLEAFGSWDGEEIEVFSGLFQRFVDDLMGQSERPDETG